MESIEELTNKIDTVIEKLNNLEDGCSKTSNPTTVPTLQPTHSCLVSGYTECVSYRCTENDENPNCEIEVSHGCVLCINGYFKPNWDVACLECDNIVGCNVTSGCNDFSGCNNCLDGYQRTYSNDCQFFVCV